MQASFINKLLALAKVIVVLLLPLYSFTESHAQPASDSSHVLSITPQLPTAFGAIVMVKAEIIDGASLMTKELQGEFLLKITKVDSLTLVTPLVMRFTDETGQWPNDLFALHELLYKRKVRSIDAEKSALIKKQYVGKTVNLIVYETGAFTGKPKDYHKYADIRQDVAFHFSNHLVIINGSSTN